MSAQVIRFPGQSYGGMVRPVGQVSDAIDILGLTAFLFEEAAIAEPDEERRLGLDGVAARVRKLHESVVDSLG